MPQFDTFTLMIALLGPLGADKLYPGKQLECEFELAVGKLYEMKTTKYLESGYIQTG